jgi:1,4-alpha-glucan branching enzyme
MKRFALVALCYTVLLAACSTAEQARVADESDWRDGGVCYEIFVRSFYDSDGDGVGDLEGVIQKLDYVNDGDPATRNDLGARCIWLMPIAASPSYHGYDVSDYYRVDPRYGSAARRCGRSTITASSGSPCRI